VKLNNFYKIRWRIFQIAKTGFPNEDLVISLFRYYNVLLGVFIA